ncbi:MAG: hypothetical protein K6346_07985 [Halothiobacillaceae bacterium]
MAEGQEALPGTTSLRKRWQVWTFSIAFGLVLFGFVGSNLLALFQGQFQKTQANGWKGFASGKPMQALAEDLRSTPLAEWLAQRQSELGWLILGDLGPRVRQGCPGWLFLFDELQQHLQAEQNLRQRLKIAIELNKHLRLGGHKLLIILVPDKTRIEQDHLCSLPRPPSLDARYARWIQGLTDAGVEALDLRPALIRAKQGTGAAYFHTDTHWNLPGAHAAATAVAEKIKAKGFVSNTPLQFQLQNLEERPYWGDLVRLAGLERLPEALRPAPDRLADIQFNIKATQPGHELDAQALFGEQKDERVFLVGTSFSRNAHFSDFLSQGLATEVINLAKEGGGFAQSMAYFLTHKGELTSSPTWIVWELTERCLHEPLSEHDLALLAMVGRA